MNRQEASLVFHSISLLGPGQQSHLDEIEGDIFCSLPPLGLLLWWPPSATGFLQAFHLQENVVDRNLQVVTFTIGISSTVEQQVNQLRPIVDCRPVERSHPCIVSSTTSSCVLLQKLLHPVSQCHQRSCSSRFHLCRAPRCTAGTRSKVFWSTTGGGSPHPLGSLSMIWQIEGKLQQTMENEFKDLNSAVHNTPTKVSVMVHSLKRNRLKDQLSFPALFFCCNFNVQQQEQRHRVAFLNRVRGGDAGS